MTALPFKGIDIAIIVERSPDTKALATMICEVKREGRVKGAKRVEKLDVLRHVMSYQKAICLQ